MVTDPSLCPIPPGFVVHGGFNDGFDHFKDHTPYKKFKEFGNNFGVSKRWKNPNIRSAGIVCGFQFKIGPDVGVRWTIDKPPTKILGEVDSGDVGIHFPRRDGPGGDRGGYLVSLKWFKEGSADILAQQTFNKEIPHGDYSNEHGWDSRFNLFHPDYLLAQKNIRDGQWHSILAVCYNDRIRIDSQNTGIRPIIRLYYSHQPTTRFEDFTLMGWGVDLGVPGVIPPRGPLTSEIGDDHHSVIEIDDFIKIFHFDFDVDILDTILVPPQWEALIGAFGGNGFGDELFAPEHALQIRLDDCPPNQLEIRNVYAATVDYGGITPPQNPTMCQAEAKVIIDRQGPVRDKEREIKEVEDLKETATEDEIESIQRTLVRLHRELDPLKADLRAAEFSYEKCVTITLNPPTCPAGQHWDTSVGQCVPDVPEVIMVTVPQFITPEGVPTKSAKRELLDLGLNPNIIGCQRDTCIVSRQDPKGGRQVPKGTTVIIHSVDSTF